MAVLPAEIPTGLVTGQFYFVNEDNIDADTDPELTVVSGTVTFTCEAKDANGLPVPLRMPTKKAVIVPMKFDTEFDSQGRLVPVGQTSVGVEIPATDSNLFNPTGFTWRVEFNLVDVATGYTVIIPPFSMSVPQNVTTDLVDAMPVSTSPGVITVQGPQGNTGPTGNTGPIGAGVPAGGTALQYVRKNAANTTTEWATLNAATGSVDGTMSAADKSKLDAATSANTVSTVMMRNSGGDTAVRRITIVDQPTTVDQATRKDYVDNALALKADTANLKAQGISAKLVTDAPSTYPVGYSYFAVANDVTWPTTYATIATLRYGVGRTVQTITGKAVSDVWVRSEMDGDIWVAFKMQATTAVATALLNGLMSAADKAKLDAATSGSGVASAIVQRASNGFFNVPDPTSTGHPANKAYVDAMVWDGSDITTGTISDLRIANATAALDGLMPKADKAKLDAAASLATVGTLAQRNSAGRIAVADPGTDVTAATPKSYVDGKVWDGADITTGTVAAARLPVSTGSVPGTMSAADKAKLDAATGGATGTTLALRYADGRLGVATPTGGTDAANKTYVDGKTAQVTGTTDGVMIAADKALLDTNTYASGTGASLVRRHSSGTFQAATPTQPTDVAIKSYVDVKLTATKGSAVANATVSADATSAATQLNALLATLRANNIIA